MDEENPAQNDGALGGIPLRQAPVLVKIVPEIPTIFADVVSSHTYVPGIAKFYLMRFDSDPAGSAEGAMIPVAQVVMPAEGFLNLVTFFEQRLKTMVEQGILTQGQVNVSREAWTKVPA